MNMRDHGGNLDEAMQRFGGTGWLDLSTGINRRPYPLPQIAPESWQALPTRARQTALTQAAHSAWSAHPDTHATALPGAQAAIQLVPRLTAKGFARVLGPTYNEHAACLTAEGWQVETVPLLSDLAGADLAIVVNPNNPDGQTHTPESLLALREKVGFLVVDESFGDVTPAQSLLPHAPQPGLIVLRSFGKFYGLAGLRLGFAFGPADLIAALKTMSGPWPISGPAIDVGIAALSNTQWADTMRAQLKNDAARADVLAAKAGWTLLGGTTLFRLYDTPDAQAAQDQLAKAQVWSRIFPWSSRALRLGLPGPEAEWDQLACALI